MSVESASRQPADEQLRAKHVDDRSRTPMRQGEIADLALSGSGIVGPPASVAWVIEFLPLCFKTKFGSAHRFIGTAQVIDSSIFVCTTVVSRDLRATRPMSKGNDFEAIVVLSNEVGYALGIAGLSPPRQFFSSL